ncbi:MAG: Zn-ribbon domain-containing OB-fold protein [Lautropia sp.]
MPLRSRPATADPWSAHYADGLACHEVRLQRCGDCGFVRFPAAPFCPECWSERFEWRVHRGTGRVTALVWYLEPQDPRFADGPYNVALVRLDDGPVVVSNVVEVAREALRVGDRVVATFLDEPAGFSLLAFRPLAVAGSAAGER